MYGPAGLMKPAAPRRRAFFLLLGAVVMVAAAWGVAPMAGPPIAVMAGLYGWIAGWLMRPAVPTMVAAVPEAVAPVEVAVPPVTAPSLSALRHDVRGLLSPALMMTDTLLMHADPAVQRAGEIVARTVQRVTTRLEEGA